MPSPRLAEALSRYGPDAYLLTIASDGPHTSFVSVNLNGNVIDCAIGKSAARNISREPNVFSGKGPARFDEDVGVLLPFGNPRGLVP
jgi:hypothetical protein